MKKVIFSATVIFLTSCTAATWELLQEENGLKVYTSWKELKKEEGSSKTPLRLNFRVDNNNAYAVTYDLGAEFFHDTKQVDLLPVSQYCAKAGKSYKGKLNGVYLEPKNIDLQMLKDSVISIEPEPLNVTQVEICEKKK